MRFRTCAAVLSLAILAATASGAVAVAEDAASGPSASPSPAHPAATWISSGEPVALGSTYGRLLSGVTYRSDPFRPRVEFALGAFGNKPVAHQETDWCHASVSERLLDMAWLMGCVYRLQLIRPYAVDCVPADRHPDAEGLASAILANPGMVHAIDQGDLSVLPAIAPRLDLGGRDGRVIQIGARPEGFEPVADPDHCRLLPEPGSGDPTIEIRGDVNSLLALMDVDGELVVLRVSSGGHDLASGIDAVDRGYADANSLGLAHHFFDTMYDFSLSDSVEP